MKRKSLQFQITQLRQEKVQAIVESIAVFIFSLFMMSFLPRFLFTYYYANMQLTEEPALLTNIPVFFFSVGVLYFVYALVMNFLRYRKIMKLNKQLMSEMDACCNDCSDCSCEQHGNCACGCNDDMGMVTASTPASTNMMAAKMSSLNKKKKPATKRK
jgi:hypothetical protein